MKCKKCKGDFEEYEMSGGICYSCSKKKVEEVNNSQQVLTKEKEIYNTSYIDKSLPTITVVDKNVESLTDWGELSISVSDVTAEGALDVFKKVVEVLGLEKEDK